MCQLLSTLYILIPSSQQPCEIGKALILTFRWGTERLNNLPKVAYKCVAGILTQAGELYYIGRWCDATYLNWHV